MNFIDLAAAVAVAATVCGIIILLARKPWQSHSLPDRACSGGRVVENDQISKLHRRVPGDPERVHHFRKDVREIVNRESESAGSLLPCVKAEDPLQDNSKKWFFSLKRGGREVLQNAKPLRPKQKIPSGAIDALEQSVAQLIEKCSKGNPVARQFSETFHLPDPSRVSYFYRLFGPPWKRQITVLWGFNPDRAGTNYTVPVSEAFAALRKRSAPDWWPAVSQLIILPLVFIGVSFAVMKVLPEWRAQAAERASGAMLEVAQSKLPQWKNLADRLAALQSQHEKQTSLLVSKTKEAVRTEGEVKAAKATPEASLANYPVYLKSYKDQYALSGSEFDNESREFQSLQKECEEAIEFVAREVKPRAAISAKWTELSRAADEALSRIEVARKNISQGLAAWPANYSAFKLHIDAIEKLLGDTSTSLAAINVFLGNYRLLAEQFLKDVCGENFRPKDLVSLFVKKSNAQSDFAVLYARAALVKLQRDQSKTVADLVASAKQFRLDESLPADLAARFDSATGTKITEVFKGEFLLGVRNKEGQQMTLGVDLPSFLALLQTQQTQ